MRLCLTVFCIMHLMCLQIGALSFHGVRDSYFFSQDSLETPYYQDKIKLNITDKFWSTELQYMYQPQSVPASFFTQYYEADKVQGSLNLHVFGTRLKVGNFFNVAGNGLTFRSRMNDRVLQDNNMLGYQLKTEQTMYAASFLSGAMRGSNGERTAYLDVVEVDVFPLSFLSVGITGSKAKFRSTPQVVSLYSYKLSMMFPNVDVESEFAFDQNNSNAYATYVNLSSIWKKASYSFEFTDYASYEFSNDMLSVNQAPLGLNPYNGTLQSRQLPDLYMRSQNTVHHSLGINITHSWMLKVGMSSFMTPYIDYEDRYLEQTLLNMGLFQRNTVGYSDQIRLKKRYQTIFQSSTIPIGKHVMLDWGTQLQFYDSHKTFIHDVSILVNNIISIGALSEHDDASNQAWLAGIVTYTPSKMHRIQGFFGSHRAGKVCSGGICIYQPEFDGVKIHWKMMF